MIDHTHCQWLGNRLYLLRDSAIHLSILNRGLNTERFMKENESRKPSYSIRLWFDVYYSDRIKGEEEESRTKGKSPCSFIFLSFFSDHIYILLHWECHKINIYISRRKILIYLSRISFFQEYLDTMSVCKAMWVLLVVNLMQDEVEWSPG